MSLNSAPRVGYTFRSKLLVTNGSPTATKTFSGGNASAALSKDIRVNCRTHCVPLRRHSERERTLFAGKTLVHDAKSTSFGVDFTPETNTNKWKVSPVSTTSGFNVAVAVPCASAVWAQHQMHTNKAFCRRNMVNLAMRNGFRAFAEKLQQGVDIRLMGANTDKISACLPKKCLCGRRVVFK